MILIKKKIGYVFSRLGGTAADWATTVIRNPGVPGNVQIRTDWNMFMSAFSKFSDPFARRNATDALLSLSQGASQSVLSYWTKFSELLYKSDISVDSALPLFERGLRYEIRDRLVDKDLPGELDDYVKAVVDLDNRIYRLKHEKRQKTAGHLSNGYGFKRSEEGSIGGPTPMEIGKLDLSNSDQRLKELRYMSKEESRRICFQEHRCHFCKRVVGSPPEHLAMNCPELLKRKSGQYLRVVNSEVLPEVQVPQMRACVTLGQLRTSTSEHLSKEILVVQGTKKAKIVSLIDSGAMGFGYVDAGLVEELCLVKEPLGQMVEIKVIDGSPCGSGIITHKVTLSLAMGNHSERAELLVIQSPKNPVVLGIDWLRVHNPVINWAQDEILFERCDCKTGALNANDSERVPQRQVNATDLTGLEETFMRRLQERYDGVFTSEEFPEAPPHREGVDMDIELSEGAAPPFGPIYALSKEEEVALRSYLDGALKAGIIEESKSPAGSPVLFVKKGDKSLRLCVDYRKLNAITKTNKTALPIIRDMLPRAAGSKVFSKIDLKSAFNLIRIKPGKEYLTAFRTKYGHYQYVVMPFGLKNAPGCFQAFINSIFGDLIDRGVLVYIDDLLLYTDTIEEHEKLLEEVFERLARHSLKVNPKKVELFRKQVAFLGHLISENGIEMDPKKLQAIEDWEFPLTVKGIQSFLGLCNYYRLFIPSFAKISAPLVDLTRKTADWTSTSEAQKAFIHLKELFKAKLVLSDPNPDEQFYLEMDASDYAIGGALHQRDPETGHLRPLGFYSRKLTSCEQNYDIHDKELLAIIEGLKEWRYLLIGTEKPVVIYTDHKNLQYFTETKQLNRRQARWSLFLADYNFNLKYRSGSLQVVSDALSRKSVYHLTEEDGKNNNQVLLPKELFVKSSCLKVCVIGCQLKNLRKVRFRIPLEEYSSESIEKCSLGGPEGDFMNKERGSDSSIYNLISRLVKEDVKSISVVEIEEEMTNSDSNSDYDIHAYNSDNYSTEFDEDDLSAVGDVAQFMEFEGDAENEDPPWFQYLLKYLWNGYLPMVLPLAILKKIKLISKSFIFKNDRLFKKLVRSSQLYHVPYIPYVDREVLVKKYHTTLGHMQLNTLLPLMEVRYYWPSMDDDIRKFQLQCNQCQMNTSIDSIGKRPLQPHAPVGIPFLKWGIDYVQDLPNVDGYCNIFSARCYATKRVIYCATRDRTAQTAARCIFENIVCKYGSPAEIVSDRGFMDTVLAEYLKLLEIHHLPSAAYTPRTNGLDERGHPKT